MTEFERIKNMNEVDFAIYINKLQTKAIDDYEKGFFPKGIFDNLNMLKSEILESGESLQDYYECMNDYLDGSMNI